MKCYNVVLCAVAMSLCCLAGEVRAANLITNGTFDAGLTSWSVANLVVPDTGVSPDGPSASMQSHDYYAPGDGVLHQVNTTHPFALGETYNVSFLLGAINGTSTIDIALIDETTAVTVAPVSIVLGAGTGWGSHSFSYTVDPTLVGHQWGLSVTDVLGGPWAGVDTISVTATIVPEPSSVVLTAMGVLGLLGGAWRKRT